MARGMARRVDANQARVVETLRAMGCQVQHLHMVGQGCPDLLVGAHGVMAWAEIKDGSKPPSAQALTDQEKEFQERWREYPYFILRNDQDCSHMVDMLRRFGG